MKYVKEIMWIIVFTFVGEVLNAALPLPVPAGVYGLFLMLLALMTGVIHVADVEGAGNFLLDTMTMMFLPAAVGIMAATDVLFPVLLPYIVIIVVSTILVMTVTGRMAQFILKRTEKSGAVSEEKPEEISLEPNETFGLGRRPLSPHGEVDGANGYRELLDEKEREKEKEAEQQKEVQA